MKSVPRHQTPRDSIISTHPVHSRCIRLPFGSSSTDRRRSWISTIATLIAATLTASALAAPLLAQSVSPPISEYVEKGSGAFTLSNETIFPLTAVLDVRGFEVNEFGELKDVPLDTTRVKVKLSQLSARILARQTVTIVYSAEATGGPAWFQIMSSLTGARTQSGINLRIELPHVVYLRQKLPLTRDEVLVKAFTWDSTHARVIVQVENSGDHLSRAQEVSVSGEGAPTARAAPFPFFPHGRRTMVVPWTSNAAPTKLAIKFDKFTIESAPVTPAEPVKLPEAPAASTPSR